MEAQQDWPQGGAGPERRTEKLSPDPQAAQAQSPRAFEPRLAPDLCPGAECCCGETAAYLDWVICCRKEDED